MATSFVAPFAHRPVLSPTVHVFGTPARIIRPPVSLCCNQSSSWCREDSDNILPSSNRCMSAHIAAELVVSRSSPGMALFNSGSFRSSLVISSPMLRAKFVSPTGPPIVSNKRLPAVLSLCSIAAAHKAPSVMPPSLRWAFVTGAYSRMSFAPYDTNRSSFSCPPSTRFKITAAARNLNVLHIGKRSSDRLSRRLPLPVSSAATPIRAPVRSSTDRIRFAKSLVDPGVLAASNKSEAATIDDRRDGLPSPRRRPHGMWRKLFLQQSVFPRWSHGHPLSQQPWQRETRSRSSVSAAAV